MKPNKKEYDPEGMALDDLMAAMGSMRQKRMRPKETVDVPVGMMPPEGPGRDVGLGGGEFSMPMAGVDPRLEELIRKKKMGAM